MLVKLVKITVGLGFLFTGASSLALDSITSSDVARFGFQIGRGAGYWCVVTPQATKCFSEITEERKPLPGNRFELPKSEVLALGRSIICGSFGGEAYCYHSYYDDYMNPHQNEYPTIRMDIKKLKQVSVYEYDYSAGPETSDTPLCATSDSANRCYYRHGEGDTNWTTQTIFSTSDSLPSVAGQRFVCGAVEGEVSCTGGMNPPHRIIAPKKIVAKRDGVCALLEDSIECWNANGLSKDVPLLEHPLDIISGDTYFCAEDIRGIQCWGKDFPQFEKGAPLGLAVKGFGAACKIGVATVDCSAYEMKFSHAIWMDFKNFLEAALPKLPQVDFEITRLEGAMDILASISYPNKKIFFEALRAHLKEIPVKSLSASFRNANARYLILSAIKPVIEEIGNTGSEKIRASLTAELTRVREEMGIQSLRDLELSAPVLKSSLLLTVNAYRALADRVAFEAGQKEVGQAITRLTKLLALTSVPLSASELESMAGDLNKEFQSETDLLAKLVQEPHSRGFALTIEEIAGYFRR